jgi:multiple sugar transport system ATP-binding protein
MDRHQHGCLGSGRVAQGAGIVHGRIAVVEYTGASSLLHVHLDDGHSCLLIHESEAPPMGTVVDLMVAPSRLHFFDADGRTCSA